MERSDRRILRHPEDIKKRVTGDIGKLNARLLKIANRLTKDSRNHFFGRTLPGEILTSFYRKAVYTTRGIEKLKQARLIENVWILLRVLLETYVNFFYFLKNDPKDMCRRYAAAAVLDKLKYLREVNFFDGAPALATQNPAKNGKGWSPKIRSHHSPEEIRSMRRNRLSGRSVEARAEAVAQIAFR